MDLKHWVGRAVEAVGEWEESHGPFQTHPSLAIDERRFEIAFDKFAERLKHNYPFFHPRYVGQMQKPPHPVAIVGYLAAMQINPNNQALDGGPATARMEREVIAQIADMFNLDTHLGHLTSSGTIANMEALFIARESHPGKGIAFSVQAHYTHGRMCRVLGMPGYPVRADSHGRMDLEALEVLLRGGQIGTVVLTAGTTGLGAVDPVHDAVDLCAKYGVRIHVDAAYGGFFALLAGDLVDAAPWESIADCDSVVVDPHKHGLQPYGCGAVLFRDPSVGRFYRHDSPYTYFTSEELHLGEISLECSRAGASAAALWLTFQLLPPTRAGLGNVLAAGRRAALALSDRIGQSPHLRLYQVPELDIVTYFPAAGSLSAIDAATDSMMRVGMSRGDRVYLSQLRVSGEDVVCRHPDIPADVDDVRILRSVLMKPESETYIDWLYGRLQDLAEVRVGYP